MYFIDNVCLVYIAYQNGTCGSARAYHRHTGAIIGMASCDAERQRAESSAVISLTADFASPKSIEVFGSK